MDIQTNLLAISIKLHGNATIIKHDRAPYLVTHITPAWRFLDRAVSVWRRAMMVQPR